MLVSRRFSTSTAHQLRRRHLLPSSFGPIVSVAAALATTKRGTQAAYPTAEPVKNAMLGPGPNAPPGAGQEPSGALSMSRTGPTRAAMRASASPVNGVSRQFSARGDNVAGSTTSR